MTDSFRDNPRHAGSPAHLHGDSAAFKAGVRRISSDPGTSSSTARRSENRVPEPPKKWWTRPGVWALAAAVLVLLALILSLVWDPSLGTSAPPQAVPSSADPTAVPPSQASTLPSDDGPAVSTAPADSANVDPAQPTEAPEQGGSTDIVQTPEADPAKTATLPATDITLNDAQFTAPGAWTLYGDEQIENSRRAVKLNHQATDVRLQAVTLDASGQDLATSCGSLVDSQQDQITDATRQLVVPVGVDANLGAAVRCGFAGPRSDDGVPVTVTFTLLARNSDSHMLLLRSTVPESSAGSSPEVAQLNNMICDASSSFGVVLPLC